MGNAIIPAIRFLLQRRRIVELVTNGLLLSNNDELQQVVSRIAKLRISLDVTGDDDYVRFKLPEGSPPRKPYTELLQCLTTISDYRRRFKSSLHVQVSFVATQQTFREDDWLRCLHDLTAAGVDMAVVRSDYTGRYPAVPELQEMIQHARTEASGIKIRDQTRAELLASDAFVFCRSPRLWPTLASDGQLYPCAHVANSRFEPFANLMSADTLIDLYQKIFPPSRSHLTVEEIGCERGCPALVGRFNTPSSAAKILGGDVYV
jgi:hypothetical protein